MPPNLGVNMTLGRNLGNDPFPMQRRWRCAKFCHCPHAGSVVSRGTPLYLRLMTVGLRLLKSFAASCAIWVSGVGMAVAHPHIFIDAGLRLIYDTQGALHAVEVTWRYDELYSLIILQDYNLDLDFDGVLTQAERDGLLGFDLNWNSGFSGGLEIFGADGQPLEFGAPSAVSLDLTETGQIETTHIRPVSGGDQGDALIASIYDQAFYIAFEMNLPTEITGREDCDAQLRRADLDEAYAALDAALQEIGGAVNEEDNFPEIGNIFADRVEVTCSAP